MMADVVGESKTSRKVVNLFEGSINVNKEYKMEERIR